MALTLGDNFSYQGAKPLDARLKYSTVAEMKAVGDSSMYDGCLAYCVTTDKTYQWKSTNSVDETLGRWREFSSGGGGGGTTDYADLDNKPQINENTLSGNKTSSELGLASKEDMDKAYKSDDTAFTDIVDDDYFPFYDTSATTKKKSLWSNIKSVLKTYFDTLYDLNKSDIPFYATSSTGASTTAKTASVSRGTFTLVAGAKVTVKFTNSNTASAPTLNVGSTGAKNIKYIDESGTVTTPSVWWNANEVVDFVYDGTQFIMMPTYTMALTPKGNKIQPSEIFATSEKIVGKWTDGRPIYQKTIAVTLPTATTAGTAVSSDFAIGASVKNCVYMNGWFNYEGRVLYLNDLTNVSGSIGFVRCQVLSNSFTTSADRNKVRVQNAVPVWSGCTGYVTIQYTKTTDSTSSYNLANPTDYSTSEKVVGTWIDGKPLYQKTITGTLPNITNGTSTTVDIVTLATNIKVVNMFGFAYRADYQKRSLNDFDPDTKYGASLFVNGAQNMIRFRCNMDAFSAHTYYVTIQYTKS